MEAGGINWLHIGLGPNIDFFEYQEIEDLVKKFKEQVISGNFEAGELQFRMSNLFEENQRKADGSIAARATRRMTKKIDGTVLNRNNVMCILTG